MQHNVSSIQGSQPSIPEQARDKTITQLLSALNKALDNIEGRNSCDVTSKLHLNSLEKGLERTEEIVGSLIHAISVAEARAAAAEERAAAAEERAAAAELKLVVADQRAAAAELKLVAAEERAAATNQGAAATNQGAAATNQGAAATNQGVAAANQGAAAANQGAAAANQGAVVAEQSPANWYRALAPAVLIALFVSFDKFRKH